ncbi:hypothetical protein Emed_006995 [Eimeria media]
MAEDETLSKEAAAESRATTRSKPVTLNRVLGCMYMMLFNLLCAYAWGTVCVALAKHLLAHKFPDVISVSAWPAIERPLFFAQSLAVLEVIHALLGLVRSSVTTTLMQVFSRLQLVWLLFPAVPASRDNVALVTCVAAWSFAELLR